MLVIGLHIKPALLPTTSVLCRSNQSSGSIDDVRPLLSRRHVAFSRAQAHRTGLPANVIPIVNENAKRDHVRPVRKRRREQLVRGWQEEHPLRRKEVTQRQDGLVQKQVRSGQQLGNN